MQLRDWQSRAFEQYKMSDRYNSKNFLAYVTPGGGKTIFALECADYLFESGQVTSLFVVVHTTNLREQWIDALTDYHYTNPEDVVVTYQQLSENPQIQSGRKSLVIFDEIHHAADSKSWGEAIQKSFRDCRRRILLSGTPFRGDDARIPFVTYRSGIAFADFSYGYDEALRDSVVPPIFFPTYGGRADWKFGDKEMSQGSETLSQLSKRDRTRHLNTLITEQTWISTVIESADRKLKREIRPYHGDAAGLVIAKDQAHAREIKSTMDSMNIDNVIAISGKRGSHQAIEDFKTNDCPWLITVRMVSEGVDIKRFRVGVWATNYLTELFFRQAIGRLMRMIEGLPDNSVYFFLPESVELGTFANELAQIRLHSVTDKAEVKDDSVNRELAERVNRFISNGATNVKATSVLLPGHEFTAEELARAAQAKSVSPLKYLPLEVFAHIIRITS